MKVMHENKYIFVGFENGWFKFRSNPELIDYDEEIVLVKNVRYVLRDGTIKYYVTKTATVD